MVQCLKEYEDADGKFDPTFYLKWPQMTFEIEF